MRGSPSITGRTGQTRLVPFYGRFRAEPTARAVQIRDRRNAPISVIQSLDTPAFCNPSTKLAATSGAAPMGISRDSAAIVGSAWASYPAAALTRFFVPTDVAA